MKTPRSTSDFTKLFYSSVRFFSCHKCMCLCAPWECLSPDADSAPDSSFLLMCPGRELVDGSVLGSLPHTWQTRVEFWAPGFDPAQPKLFLPFEEWCTKKNISLSRFLCVYTLSFQELCFFFPKYKKSFETVGSLKELLSWTWEVYTLI